MQGLNIMKNFLSYLTESQKIYEFKIKFANLDPTEKMDALETALDAYGLDSITKPKSLPIVENNLDFPTHKSCETWVIEANLLYPVNSDQLHQIVSERTGINKSCISVVPKNAPEELWRNNEGELREFKQGEAVLDKELEDSPEGKELGKKYTNFTGLFKELSEAKFDLEKTDPETSGSTTNELPQNNLSPVGSKQNKIPKAKK